MHPIKAASRVVHAALFTLGLVAAAAPVRAQWARVTDLPATPVYSVWANGDTLAAGVDTAVYVSTNAGATWRRSARPVAAVAAIPALWFRNGRLYAGTFGQGAHVSDDLGRSWSPYNQGLVGGFQDSQLKLNDFQVRGDSLYAATSGAGVYVRGLRGPATWHPFGAAFEPNQASNVNDLALGGRRLLASAGANGMVFFQDPGDADWTVSNLDNVGIHAGLQAAGAAWTGAGWIVGTNRWLFTSTTGREPWTRVDPGFGGLDWMALTTQGRRAFAAFDVPNVAIIESSGDDGATWGTPEFFEQAFVLAMAVSRNNLYAARADGLWRRTIGSVGVPEEQGPGGLGFALVGPQPIGDRAPLRFDLPEAGAVTIQLYDVMGRVVGERLERWYPAGPEVASLDTRRLASGIYAARLTAGGRHAALRLVHVAG